MTLLRMREPNVVAYRRVGSGREVVVVIAFGRDGAVVRLPQPLSRRAWRTIAGSVMEAASPQGDGRTLRLRAWEAVILVAEGGSMRRPAAGS